MVYETFFPEETFELGRRMGKNINAGSIVTLSGDMGAGKTVFAQGFAKGMGIDEPVNSPTFTIVQVYNEGKMPLYHFDVYRIADPEEMYEIGYEEYFYGEGVCLIEWAERIEELLPDNVINVKIEKSLDNGVDYRRITVENGDIV